MTMKNKAIILSLFVVLLCSCGTKYPYAYVKDAPRNEEMPITNNYTTTIFPGDRLKIRVDSRTPQSTYPFNEETNRSVRIPNSRQTVNAANKEGFLVDQDGTIQYPVLGKIPAAGKTLDELARYIEGRLIEGRYVKDPTVTVSMPNFHVTVIGEVKTPKMIQVDGNRITIFEAIAQCGDVTMDGLRDNVKVIRFEGEDVIVGEIDLTSVDALESPFYYLKQNDVVYVEPTPKKKKTAYRDEDWPQYISMGASGVRIAYSLVYRWIIRDTYNRYTQ